MTSEENLGCFSYRSSWCGPASTRARGPDRLPNFFLPTVVKIVTGLATLEPELEDVAMYELFAMAERRTTSWADRGSWT